MFTDEFTYDRTSDEWQPIAASPLSPGVHPQGIWTGQERLFYAGAEPQDEASVAAARYDPVSSNTWLHMPETPGFDERDRHGMVWVRDQLFITGRL